MGLTQRTAIVTGGARGIGAAIARELVTAGARVVVTDVREAEGKTVAESHGERAIFAHLDVTNAYEWDSVLETAERAFGPVAVLVNNAGVVDFGRITDQSPEAFRRVLDINLYGVWLGMRSALPSLRRAGDGSIINVSSTAGLAGYPNLGAYVASKWAVRGLTKTAAVEFGPEVRVCSIHPGSVDTPMTEGMDQAAMSAVQPLPRFGKPAEIARMVRFVASEATYSTGAEFVADGGLLAATATPEVQAT